MADYWAQRNSIPFAQGGEANRPEFLALVELQSSATGLSLDQGQVDIAGAIEMIGALQYHFQRFVQIVQQKSCGAIPCDAADERFEAVAYIGRIGQFYYFAKSPFVRTILGLESEKLIPSIVRLVPLRQKYAAHRARDQPLNAGAINDLNAELALGALGGHHFVERVAGSFERLHQEHPATLNREMQRYFGAGFTVFALYTESGSIDFNLELDHVAVVKEAVALVQKLICHAKTTPKS